MKTQKVQSYADLYEEDETAWLETMSRLLAERRCDELDFENLSEYLNEMARKDRREVLSRLTTLLAHLLKWEHQPQQRSRSWQATITAQRQELHDLIENRTLANYATEMLSTAYERAVVRAAQETGLAPQAFPPACPFTLDAALGVT